MSILNFNGKKIKYRVVGEGKPLLILNGIMMSTRSWEPFEKAFTKHNNQLILLDLIDQGESDKYDSDFENSLQAEVVKALLDELKIEKINIMGTSYGGEVALQFAAKYQERVERMVLSNTVARTNAWLQEIGEAWNCAASNPTAYYATTIPVIYSPQFYDRRAGWMKQRKDLLIKTAFASKPFMDSMVRLTNSSHNYNVVEELSKINVRTLVIGCENDHITPLEEQRLIVSLMPNAELIILPDTGHAAFYERPLVFISLLTGFINAEDVIV